MTEDEIAEMLQDEMAQDIQYHATEYDSENEDHVMTMHEQNDKPHEI
jgi:hypothetical protein